MNTAIGFVIVISILAFCLTLASWIWNIHVEIAKMRVIIREVESRINWHDVYIYQERIKANAESKVQENRTDPR